MIPKDVCKRSWCVSLGVGLATLIGVLGSAQDRGNSVDGTAIQPTAKVGCGCSAFANSGRYLGRRSLARTKSSRVPNAVPTYCKR